MGNKTLDHLRALLHTSMRAPWLLTIDGDDGDGDVMTGDGAGDVTTGDGAGDVEEGESSGDVEEGDGTGDEVQGFLNGIEDENPNSN